MLSRHLGSSIDLGEDEAGSIIGLLEHIEAGDARLPDTLTRIFKAGFPERLD